MSTPTLSLYTYGAGDLLSHFFTALASQHGADTPYRGLIHLVTLMAGTWALVAGVIGRRLLATLQWLGVFFVMFYLLFLPTVKLDIIDRTQSNQHYLVSGVPLGLGVAASLTSQIGEALTRLVEPLFSAPKALRYQQSGLLFGAQILAASRDFTLQAPELRRSLESFMQQCVFYDLVLMRYRLEDLQKDSDPWRFLQTNVSRARAFVLFPQEGPGQIVSCSTGVQKLNAAWNDAIQTTAKHYGGRWFPHAADPGRAFLQFLPLSLDPLQKISLAGPKLLQQMLLKKSLDNALGHFAAKVDAPAAMTQYAVVKAQQQKRLSNETMGHMAAYWLPLMKNVFETLLYGAFLLVFLLCLFPFGLQVFKNYIFALLWVQSWAPLYAIINGVSTFYLSTQIVNGTGLGFISELQQINHDLVGLAGYLSMSVPFLAMGLIRSLSGTFTQLATAVGGISQSAVGSSVNEAVSGNISLGNVQLGNASAFNTSRDHWQGGGSVQSGWQNTLPSGASLGMSANEGVVLNARPASSQFNGGLHLSSALRHSTQEAMEMAESAMKSDLKQYGESFSHAARGAMDLALQQSHNENQGAHYSKGTSSQLSEDLSFITSNAQKFARDHHISLAKSRRLLLSAYLGAKLSGLLGHNEPTSLERFPLVGKKGEASLSAGGKGELSRDKAVNDTKLFQSAQDFIQQQQFSARMDNVLRYADENHYQEGDGKEKRLLSDIHSALENATHARHDYQAQYQKSLTLHHTAQSLEEESANIDVEGNQAFFEFLLKQPSPNAPERTLTADEITELSVKDPKAFANAARDFTHTFTEDWLKKSTLDSVHGTAAHWQQEIAGKEAIFEQAKTGADLVVRAGEAAGLTQNHEINAGVKNEVEYAKKHSTLAKNAEALRQQNALGGKKVFQHMDELKHKGLIDWPSWLPGGGKK